MRDKQRVLAVFHAAALFWLAAGCGRATMPGAAASARAGMELPAPAATRRLDPCAGLKDPLPPPVSFVADFAGVLDAGTRRRLEEKLTRLKAQAGVEFLVATVKTTGGQFIFDYSLALARCWGVDPPEGEPGGGILLLIAIEDRRWQFQISRQLEADLPDRTAGEIGRRMRPHFRKGDYGHGLEACADEVIAHLASRRNSAAG